MVFETIRALLAEQLGFEESEITRNASLADDLQAQEADLQEVMILLEQEYELEWTDEDLRSMETVRDLVTFVENQVL